MKLSHLGKKAIQGFESWCEDIENKSLIWMSELWEMYQGRGGKHQLDLERRTGMKLLSMGEHRIVFDAGDYVVKVSHDGGGENLREVKLWERATAYTSLRDKLVPIVAHDRGGRWLVMEKASPLTRESVIPFSFESVTVGDMKAENFGIHGGKVKMFDYSEWLPEDCSKEHSCSCPDKKIRNKCKCKRKKSNTRTVKLVSELRSLL